MTEERRQHGFRHCCHLVVLLLLTITSGCLSSRMPSSLSALVPGPDISGQWEPEVEESTAEQSEPKSE